METILNIIKVDTETYRKFEDFYMNLLNWENRHNMLVYCCDIAD